MKKNIIGPVVLISLGLIVLLLGCQSKEVTSAKVYIQQDDWPKAIEQLEQAVSLYPNNPEAHYLLGEGYAWKREWAKMNEMFDKSLAIGPQFEAQAKNTRERHWVNNFNSGVGKVNGGDTEGAIKSFTTCLIINPNKVEAYKNLAFAYLQADSTDAAKQTYLALLENAGEDLEAMSSLSRLYVQDKEYQKALELEQKVLEKDPDNKDAMANLALINDFMGNTDKAFQLYEDAIAKNPGDKDLLFNLGRLYFMKGNYDTAIEKFKEVIAKDPEDFDSNVNVGNAYLQMGDQYRKELKEKEDAGKEITKEEMDKLKELFCNSIPYLEKASELKPDDATSWNNLGVAYINCGDKERGQEAFKKVEELGK